jgi:Cell wall-active antibiotics response 4TMS YvqF/Domain of unknown function (DUF1707)
VTEPKSSIVPAALAARKDNIVDRLTQAFADDVIDLDEFDRRTELVHQSSNDAALDSLVADLPTQVAVAPIAALVPARSASGNKISVIFGSVERDGEWSVPAKLQVRSIFSSCQLDFREARFTAAVTDIHLGATFANIEIIVPPNVAVEFDVGAVLGSAESKLEPHSNLPSDAPQLRFTGRTIFGSIEVSARRPGESKHTAAKRIKAQQRARANSQKLLR